MNKTKIKHIFGVSLMSITAAASLIVTTCYLYHNQDISLTSEDKTATLVLTDVNLMPGENSLTTSYGRDFNVRDLRKYQTNLESNSNYIASYGDENANSLLVVNGRFFVSSVNTLVSSVSLYRGQITFGQGGKYSVNLPKQSLNITRYYDGDYKKYCFMSSFRYDRSFFYSDTSDVTSLFKTTKSDNISYIDDLTYNLRVYDEVKGEYFSSDVFQMKISIKESMYSKEVEVFGIDPDQSVIVEL